jgi:hypothetical protein
MQVSVPYKNLKHTLQSLKVQVEDSLPYVEDFVPDTIQNPEELFYFLKDLVTYKKDPKGRELLQTVQTLLTNNNWHGIPGHGDCDCFTILALAACQDLGFQPQQVALVGNSKFSPSHIYSLVYDHRKKKMCSMDLTNPYYDMERPYKYKQTLNFMILELADSRFIPLASKAKRKAKKAARQEKRAAKKAVKAERKAVRQAAKTARITARQEKKTARVENKMARKISRQERRTDRVDQKKERKALKRAAKVQRKENRLIRVTGRGEIIRARQEAKLNNVMYPETSYDQSYSPDADNILMPDIPAAGYEASGYYPPQGGNIDYSYAPEEEYSDYELIPEEEYYEQEYPEEYYEEEEPVNYYQEEEYYEEEEYPEYYEELSLPFLPAIFTGVKALVNKAKGAAQKIQSSRVGKAVTTGTSKYNELVSAKKQVTYLNNELHKEKRNKIVYAVSAGVAGVVVGAVLRKVIK